MSRQTPTIDSVGKLVEGLWGQDAFAETVKQRIAQRRIVSTLQAMRVARNIPQSRIADELKCSQSRVSKIEQGDDGELKISELEAYARVFESDLNLVFSRRDTTAVDRVKGHVFAIKTELEKMAQCVQGDHAMATGVANFFGEAFLNFINILQDAAKQLPKLPDSGEPYIHISTTDAPAQAPPANAGSQAVAEKKTTPKRRPRIPTHA